ncbi:LytTR family transcriptional regulator [Rhodobacter sp. JA431]|uniref:LytTR family transcriptional regulator DNA-binding domain-containing protein n=1 Tax=Rhodobacter sp. JA431 TaxID=570013 RepID=UPI000BD66C54|nr:LytTR family transcriptional regulator DNA-binding domain-containing protein [Rhodobacter sp. JA431]SOC15604.1 LytTR family transcriptional regulator [Rhodobacter sp. JA431]
MIKFLKAYKRAVFLPIVPVVWAMLSIIGVIGAPFGSGHLGLLNLFLFWPVVIGLSILCGAALRVLVREYMGFRSFWPEAPLIAFFAACLLAPGYKWLAVALSETTQMIPNLFALFGYAFVVSLVISTFRHILSSHPTPVISSIETKPTPPPAPVLVAKPRPIKARIFERLEPELRAPLLRLEVNDHYVDVVTEAGKTSLLLRLADAIAETEGIEGLQVHRSHWVARKAMTAVRRERGKCTLVLRDGTQVPVSRSQMPVVLELGLPECDLDATSEA